MKRIKKYLFGFACVCLMAMALSGRAEAKEIDSGYCGYPGLTEGKDVKWSFDDNGTLTISGKGDMNYTMWYDRNYWPYRMYASQIKSVIIKDGVTSIGETAFMDCSNLTNVVIPESVVKIAGDAFSGCSSLKSIRIPKSIQTFSIDGCTGFTEIIVDAENDNYSSENGVLFNKDKTELIYYPRGKKGTYVIPKSVTTIWGGAFSGCSGLTGITIQNGVTTIGSGAFKDCNNLLNIHLPNTVTHIERNAFDNCSSLKNITIPAALDRDTSYAYGLFFEGCDSLSEIKVDTGSIKYCSVDGVLYNKDKTEIICCPRTITGTYTIPNTVKKIGYYAFSGCSGLTEVKIPNSVTTIGYYAFSGCSGLTEVKIPSGVISIAPGAFSDCSSVKEITVDPGNKNYCSEGGVLFNKDKTSLINYPGGRPGKYTVPSGVTIIDNSAFYGCNKLTEVTIPKSVIFIYNCAFYGCSGLTSITIPDNVQSVLSQAFYGCTGLKSISLPDDVLLGASVFEGCTGLTSITLPPKMSSIFGGKRSDYGKRFANCTSLKTIIISQDPWIDKEYPYNIYLPDDFEGCDSLTDIYFAGNKEQWEKIIEYSFTCSSFTWNSPEGFIWNNPTVHFNSKNSAMTLNGTKLTLKTGATSKAIKATLTNDSIDKVTSSDNTKKIIASAKKSGKTIVIKAGKSVGKATVTVTSKSGIKCEISVSVQKKKVTTTKLTLSKTKVTLAKKGKKATITVTATPDKLSTGEAIKFSMSKKDKKIASYKWDEKTGKLTITAKKKGKAKITAKAGKKSKTITVNVKK